MATFDNVVYMFGGKFNFGGFSQSVWKMDENFEYAKIPETMRSLERHDFTSFQVEIGTEAFGFWLFEKKINERTEFCQSLALAK